MINNYKNKIIIDTDPGHDDALAMLMLLQSNKFDIKAVTTVAGNSSIKNVTRNAQAILDLFDSNIEVFSGKAEPIKRKLVQAVVHGESGFDGFDTSSTKFKLTGNASEKIIEIVKANPNEITLLCVGPLTNLARAIMFDPTLPKLIKEVVIMGGAIDVPGNKNRVAEFNFFVDPEAADIVFKSKIKKTLIPLDLCTKVVLGFDEFENILNKEIKDTLLPMMKLFQKGLIEDEGTNGILAYDALAAYFLINPDIFETKMMDVLIETKGELTSGMSVAERRDYKVEETNVKVCFRIDKEKFREDLFGLLSRN